MAAEKRILYTHQNNDSAWRCTITMHKSACDATHTNAFELLLSIRHKYSLNCIRKTIEPCKREKKEHSVVDSKLIAHLVYQY